MKVLIVVHSPTWFTELSRIGRYIHSLPEHKAVFYIVDYAHWTAREFAARLRAEDIPCILEKEPQVELNVPTDQAAASAMPTKLPALSPIKQLVIKYKDELQILRKLRDFLLHLRVLRKASRDARMLAAQQRPDVVILGGDNPGYSTAAFIRSFHARGIPTVIVSSTMSNGLEEAEIFAKHPEFQIDTWFARVAASIFPKWARTHKDRRILRCPASRVFAMELLRLAPPKPWIFNSGHAEALAMESQAMIDYYVDAGLARDRMFLTGSPSDDAMARNVADAPNKREELYSKLDLPSGRPMFLTALPPDFLYLPGGRPECAFARYDDLVEHWIAALAEQDRFNVVVALHPSVKVETMRHIERCNVRISELQTAQLVPLCDVYVASISSTIRWAIACGKPVINYDVYRYRYTDFVGVAGVLTIEEEDEFCALIHRFASDEKFLLENCRRQQAEAPRWGRLDGSSCGRILDLLACVAERRMRNVAPKRLDCLGAVAPVQLLFADVATLVDMV